MKKILKIAGISLLALIALLIVLPFAFKGKIIEKVKSEANKNLNARVDFSGISLSLIRNFPNFTLGIRELTLTGVDKFEKDTLLYVEKLSATLNLKSVLRGDAYEIKKVLIDRSLVNLLVLEDGSASYDIMKPSADTVEAEQPADTSSFRIRLKNIGIKNMHFIYDDRSAGLFVEAAGFSNSLSGDLSADMTSLTTDGEIAALTGGQGGITYLNKALLALRANITADLKNSKYTIQDNEIRLNELVMTVGGSVAMPGDDIDLDLAFKAMKTDFKNILSLVPAIYMKDFSDIKTSGKMMLEGFARGIYNDSILPAYELVFMIEDGMFQYPALPKPVSDINVDLKVSSRGGDPDNTLLDVRKFHFEMAGNPMDIQLSLATPVSDPQVDGSMKGRLDLATVREVYPLEEGSSLDGILTADVALKGKLSSVEYERYEEFKADGSINLNGLSYRDKDFPGGLDVSRATLNFSPAFLELAAFDSKMGKNDFSAHGKLENYLTYALSDGILKGSLETRSSFLDLNELMGEPSTGTAPASPADTSAITAPDIPKNIDFTLRSAFGKLIYDKIVMEDVSGLVSLSGGVLNLKDLSARAVGGKIVVNGSYSSLVSGKPVVDLALDLNQVDIQQAYNTFTIFSKYAPIAKKTSGNFSAGLKFKTALGPDMMPVYESLNGAGRFSSTDIVVSDVNTINKIAEAVKMDQLKNMMIDKILFDFELVDGKIVVKPFDLKYNSYQARLGGTTGLDQAINYVMNLQMPRGQFGGAANSALEGLVAEANKKGTNFSLGDMVDLDIYILGTLTEPQVKTSLKDMATNALDDMKQQLVEEVNKKKEEIKGQITAEAQKILAEADAKAQKVLDEASRQAENIRKTARDAAQKLRDEAEKQAANIESEGKKKGFLAEKLAKESAKKVRDEANAKADKMVAEADQKANDVMAKARLEADKIKATANEQVNKAGGK